MASQNVAPGPAVNVSRLPATANDLWAAAVLKLSEHEQREIQMQHKDKLTVLNDALSEAKQNAAQCVAKEWKVVRADGRKVIFRDLFDKIVSWIDNFKQIGDLAASFESTYAAPAWGVVKILLQVAIGDSKIYVEMLESLETVTNMITQYAIFEEIYLKHSSKAQDLLQQSIIKLYAQILTHLLKIKAYFAQNTAKRMAKGIVTLPDFVSDGLEKIRAEQSIAGELARLIDAEEILAKRHSFSDLRTMLSNIQQPLNRIDSELTRISRVHDKQQKKTILGWISRTRHSEHHEFIARQRLRDSGLWLIDHPVYVDWRQSSSSCILWLHGIPGSGKSTLMSLVVDSLRENQLNKTAAPLAYAYCLRNSAEPDRAEPVAIVRSLLRQLASPTSTAPVDDIVRRKYDAASEDDFEPRSLNFDECEDMILDILRQRSTTIVIDALDECVPEKRYELLGFLERLTNSTACQVKLIVSSRDHGDVADRLQGQNVLAINTSEDLGDIDLYIQAEVESSIQRKAILRGNVSEDLRLLIVDTLKKGAQGMFLWVSLIIRNLCDAERIQFRSDAEEELKRLPKGLNDLYATICQRIRTAGSKARQLAETSLKWLICSQSSLTSAEFVAFVSMNVADSGEIASVSSILDVCSNLVVHDTDLDVLRLTHLSIREFLETQSEFATNVAHAAAADVCFKALTNPEWLAPSITWSTSVLYRYATLYGTTHLSMCDRQQRTTEFSHLRDRFFALNGNLTPESAKWMVQITQAAETLGFTDPIKPMVRQFAGNKTKETWIFVACIYGLDELVEEVCQLNSAVAKEVNAQGATTLHLASQYGHLHITELLLRTNLEIDAKNEDGESALTLASVNGHVQIVRHLLQRQALQEDTGSRYGSPIQAASFGGHKEIVELLGMNADLEASRGKFGTALQAASFRGHTNVVRVLLELGASVNAPNRSSNTGFESANEDPDQQASRLKLFSKELARLGVPAHLDRPSRRRYEEIMLDQIRDGVLNNDISTAGLGSAVQAGCRGGHVAVVKLLLNHHADIEYEGGLYGHALQAAAVSGNICITNLLLDAKVNVNAQSGLYGCALQAACRQNHISLAEVLLKAGSEVNMHGGYYHTPLQAAARTGNSELIRLLLQHGANVNLVGGHYHTAMQAAAAYGFTEIVQQLLDHDADVNVCGGQYHSAIEAAAHFGSVNTIELLLARRANVFNALQIAALEGHVDVVRYFLEQGVDVNANNRVFGTPLLSAISTNRHEIIELLLKKGADPTIDNYLYGCPLQLAVAAGNTSLVRQLLGNGCDPTQAGSSYAVKLTMEKVEILASKTSRQSRKKSSRGRRMSSESRYTTNDTGLLYMKESALESAAIAGSSEMSKMLLENMLSTVHMRHPWQSIQRDVTLKAFDIINLSLAGAVQNNHSEIINIMLDMCENEANFDTASALWWACEKGDEKLLRRILDKSKERSYDNEELNYIPLEVAVRNGHRNLVPLLVGSNVSSCFQGKVHNALEVACDTGDESLVSFFLDKECDIDRAGQEVVRPLMLASASGNAAIVRSLLCAGANPNFWSSSQRPDEDEQPCYLTALHAACAEGHKEVVSILLSHGSFVDVKTDDCPTPFILACEGGNLAILEMLIQKGADVNTTETLRSYSRTPLTVAISKGFHEITKLLLDNKADCNAQSGTFGPPLKTAAYYGHTDILIALLEAGADVNFKEEVEDRSEMRNYRSNDRSNMRSNLNTAALYEPPMDDFAAESLSGSEYEDAVEEPQIQSETIDDDGRTFYVERRSVLPYREHGDPMTEKGAHSSHIQTATLYRNQHGQSITVTQNMKKALVKISIRRLYSDDHVLETVWCNTGYFDRNILRRSGRYADDDRSYVSLTSFVRPKYGLFGTAIHAAAHTGSVDCIRVLLKYGAEISHQDRYGLTPLHYAASKGHFEVLTELLKRQPLLDVRDEQGRTPLMLATISGHIEILRTLLSHGAAVDVKDNDGQTALFEAAQHGHLAILKLLIDKGANINHMKRGKWTPLHAAVRENHQDIMTMLIKHGAIVQAGIEWGMTPLYQAISRDHVQAAQQLFNTEGGTGLPSGGLTLLHEAAKQNSYKCVHMLIRRNHDVNACTPVQHRKGANTPLHLALGAIDYSRDADYHDSPHKKDGILLLNTVSVLLCNGANPNAKNYHGETPVSLAISDGRCAVVDVLIRAGGDVKAKPGPEPVIHHALRSRSLKMIKLVLDLGADVNEVDEQGQTAMFLVTSKLKPPISEDVIALLLQYDAHALPKRMADQFRRIRSKMQTAEFKNHFFDCYGFDLEEPLYDLSDTAVRDLIRSVHPERYH